MLFPQRGSLGHEANKKKVGGTSPPIRTACSKSLAHVFSLLIFMADDLQDHLLESRVQFCVRRGGAELALQFFVEPHRGTKWPDGSESLLLKMETCKPPSSSGQCFHLQCFQHGEWLVPIVVESGLLQN